MTVEAVVPLDYMRAGETGRVVEVGGDVSFVHRLEEMGLRAGVSVLMLQPGCPCILRVGDQRLSFRSEGQAVVLVALNSQNASCQGRGTG